MLNCCFPQKWCPNKTMNTPLGCQDFRCPFFRNFHFYNFYRFWKRILLETYLKVMLILILIDFQHSQKAVFSFEKGSNHQNHSSSGSQQNFLFLLPPPLPLFGKPWHMLGSIKNVGHKIFVELIWSICSIKTRQAFWINFLTYRVCKTSKVFK